MTIEYVNVEMKPISLEQLELVTEYFKLYKVDGLLKKIEFYDNNQLEESLKINCQKGSSVLPSTESINQ